jgi:hypothetical protein
MNRLHRLAPKWAPALAAALFCAACAVTPAAPPGASAPAPIPSTPFDLGGNWQSSSVGATLERFRNGVTRRYSAGLAVRDVAADLRDNDFNCRNERGAGAETPTQVCRKTETVSDCTHTWQVHIFDTEGDNVFARARSLYDRRCGGDGLLGGPG